jgi:hypothetical protein
VLLDCHDLETAIASLAHAIRVSPAELEQALRQYDGHRLTDYSEDPELRMPSEILATLGSALERVELSGAYYFHGTRAVRPESFRERGVLQLGAMLEEIWATLFRLVAGEVSARQWQEFREVIERDAGGHDGSLYRHKASPHEHSAQLNQGPFAMLVREFFFRPRETTSQDYLGCPEIIQDIARCFESLHGIDLESRFCATTVPCIVRIRSERVFPRAIRASLWYAFSMIRDDELSSNARWGYDFERQAVPPENVVDVEVVT